MVKAAPMGGVPSRKQPAYQPPPPTDKSGSASQVWHAYASGGARVDDAETLRKMQEKDEKFLEGRGAPTRVATATLVDVSPTKAVASANADLLLETDFQVQPLAQSSPPPRIRVQEQLSYADATKKDKKIQAMPTTLLD